MRIIRLSSLKQRRQQFKELNSPTLLAFIDKYENLIPWDEVKIVKREGADVEQWVQSYIRENVLSDIYSKIDPNSEDSIYLKDIDMEKEFKEAFSQPNRPAGLDQLYQDYKKNPEAIKKQYIDKINNAKINSFNDWKEYLTKGNDIYSEDPAFQYLTLAPIIKDNASKKSMAPLSADPMALANIYQMIQGGKTQFNFVKLYQKIIEDSNKKQVSHVTNEETGSGWVMIPSINNDPDNFEKNKERLKSFSIPNGWCTGAGMEDQYLRRGDFWLYTEGGKARVAIRFDGNKIAEIQGPENQRPFAYWEEILKFVDHKGFDKESQHYKELEKSIEVNNKVESNDSGYIEYLKMKIGGGDLNYYSMLKEENKKIFREVAIARFVVIIKQSPYYYYKDAKESFSDDPEALAQFREVAITSFIKLIQQDIDHYEEAKENFSDDPEALAQFREVTIPIFIKQIQQYPNYYYKNAKENFSDEPEALAQFREVAIPSFIKQIQQSPNYYKEAKENFSDEPEALAQFREVAIPSFIKQIQQYPNHHYYEDAKESFSDYPEALAQIREVAITRLVEIIQQNPGFYEGAKGIFSDDPEALAIFEQYNQHRQASKNWYKLLKKSQQLTDQDRSNRDKEQGKSLKDTGYSYKIAKIYRAVQNGVTSFTYNDYITLSKKFAVEHAESNKWYHQEDQQVIETIAMAEHVIEASNPGEYFYAGPDKVGKVIYTAKFEDDDELV